MCPVSDFHVSIIAYETERRGGGVEAYISPLKVGKSKSDLLLLLALFASYEYLKRSLRPCTCMCVCERERLDNKWWMKKQRERYHPTKNAFAFHTLSSIPHKCTKKHSHKESYLFHKRK